MNSLYETLDEMYDMERSAFLLDRLDSLGLLEHGDKFKLHIVISVQELLREIAYNEPFEQWTLLQTINKLTSVNFSKVDTIPKRKLNKVLRDCKLEVF